MPFISKSSSVNFSGAAIIYTALEVSLGIVTIGRVKSFLRLKLEGLLASTEGTPLWIGGTSITSFTFPKFDMLMDREAPLSA